MSDDGANKWWYNLKTGEVEQGFVSPSADRAGPFGTRDEAANAMDTLHKNAQKWAEEDAADNR
ncbi:SPOR domain-containing protein [Microbacteriaceae bacterium VKM Ac-2855]|nr:SPOR domain-containing protein [Microbacteriaceae bacterium VKM Ac-2855]